MIKLHVIAAASFCLLLSSTRANADVRLVNLSGKPFTVDLQLPSQRLKNLSLTAGFDTASSYKTPAGERRYPLSIILKSADGEWKADGQDNGVYAVHRSGDGFEPQFLGYIKKDFDMDNWVKVWNTTPTPMTLELYYPNGESDKHQLDAVDEGGYRSLTYAAFGSSDGPTAKPGETRRFELKNADGQVLATGSASLGQVFLVTGGAGGYTIHNIGWN